MLILSSFDNDSRFVEIANIDECESVESDCYVYISIDSILQRDLEKYFKISKFLHENEVQYAVLLNIITSYYINTRRVCEINRNNIGLFDKMKIDKPYYRENLILSDLYNIEASLQLILSMFAKHGASFCIFSENNYDLLPFAQSYANYHLLDIKILGLVDSYMQAGLISSWSYIDLAASGISNRFDKFIHIDGVIEKSLLIGRKTKAK